MSMKEKEIGTIYENVEETNITCRQILFVLRRDFLKVIAIVLLGFGLVTGSALVRPKTYASEGILYFSSVDQHGNALTEDQKTTNIPVIFGHWQLTVKTEHLKHENISLPEHMFYTDQLFVVHSLSGIETISFLDFPVYSYRVGRDGQTVSRQSRIKNADQAVTVFKYILDVYSEKVEQGKSNPVLQARVARYYHYVIKTLLLLPRSMNAFKQLISLEKYTKEKSPAIYKDVFTMGRPVSVLRMTGYLVYFYVGGKIKNWE